ncbi:hypothetical protein Tco_0670091 [Tanacetum coccineum]
MSEPMPTIPTQSPFTYPNPNPSASPSFTQDDTSESFIPEPTQPMPTFTQTAFSQPAFSQPNQSIFSQPAVHFQQTQPTQTNQTLLPRIHQMHCTDPGDGGSVGRTSCSPGTEFEIQMVAYKYQPHSFISNNS